MMCALSSRDAPDPASYPAGSPGASRSLSPEHGSRRCRQTWGASIRSDALALPCASSSIVSGSPVAAHRRVGEVADRLMDHGEDRRVVAYERGGHRPLRHAVDVVDVALDGV